MAILPDVVPDLFASIMINTTWTPGKVTLSGHNRAQSFEEQRPKGKTGWNTVHHGPKPFAFTASFFLADADDLDQWEIVQKLLESSLSGPKPKVLYLYHPDLIRNKILDAVVEEIGGFVHDGKNGTTVAVKFREYRPPKERPATKPAAGKPRTGDTSIDPNAAAKRELAALLDQAKAP
jgi:hypothetical protein